MKLGSEGVCTGSLDAISAALVKDLHRVCQILTIRVAENLTMSDSIASTTSAACLRKVLQF